MKKVVLALSGGVDSSVAAALLKQQGYEVMGMTMRLWQDERQPFNTQAEIDAAKVCEILGIKHQIVDYRDVFRKTVVDYFLAEYAAARTPNPCVYCNKKIKFGELFKSAMAAGGDYLATGHYVRLANLNDKYYIQKAKCLAKDQSYVLYHLPQTILSHVLFPLGEYSKDQVRAMAKELNLPVFAKKDSQEICFIPDNDHHGFMRCYGKLADKPGNFVDVKGLVLGRHQGLSHYTIGQRKGLGIAAKEPLFVLDLDKTKNQVVLGFAQEAACLGLTAVDVSFSDGNFRTEPFTCQVKIRYNAKPQEAVVTPDVTNKGASVLFTTPLRGIAPGQAVVFYQDDICLGGGTIVASIH